MSRTRGHVPLFRRLPHGPSPLGREEVARNQRARIYGGMIESVSQRGYRETTVADVIALAGVSRRAFYEQFANKEDCFLCTYDIVVARARKRVIEAWQAERGWSNRLHAGCRALLEHLARAPKGPRLVLVDAPGIGAQARERMQLAALAFERLISVVFDVAPDGVQVPPLAARAIVGGVRHLAFVRLLERREAELALLTDEVLDWIGAYRSSAPARLATAPSPRSQRSPASAFLVGEDERSRALRSLVALTLQRGYCGLSDAQVARGAGISTETFRRHFAGTDACYLAVLDAFAGEAQQAAARAVSRARTWPEAVHGGMAAFVCHLSAHEALMRLAFVEVFDVGPATLRRTTRSVEALTGLLTAQAPPARRGPGVAAEAVTGALWAVLSGCATGERLARLPSLAAHLSFLVMAPYLGPKAAVQAIHAAQGAVPAL
jgi:AcrR family transcriptional regulator